MHDLNYELKQLCARNRDGSFATQANRERILTLIANQLREMGFVNMHVQSLKPKHVDKLVERWKAERLSAGTLKNRMATLRWWAEKNGKANVVAKSNEAYGIADRCYVTNVSKARELTSGDLTQISDPYTRMSLRLQATFGLRREESLKIPGRAGRIAATPCSSRPVGAKVVVRARSNPQRCATPRSGRGEALCRQGQSHSSRPKLRAAAPPLRIPVRPGGHPPRPRPPASVCPGALPGTDRVAGPGGGWTAIKTADTRAEADRSRGAADHQQRARARARAGHRHLLCIVERYVE